jgi:hypothetical protein
MSAKFLNKELTGFYAGQRNERDYILHFITTHAEQGVKLTAQDIKEELILRDKFEMKKVVDEITRSWND